MLKTVDHLFHITTKLQTIKDIFTHGFKVSYASEMLGDRNIKVAMISFSNILLRDVGEEEILNYGKYGVAVDREWGIQNEINPVLYTYPKGLLDTAIQNLIENAAFLAYIKDLKDPLRELSDKGQGPISKRMTLSNTSKQSIAILDYLSIKYDDELVEIISSHSKVMHEINLLNIMLTKSYKVTGKNLKEFIAYNDREWRKIYLDLPILFEQDNDYKKWRSDNKPHFNVDPYILHFTLQDIKAILVENEDQINEIVDHIGNIYGNEEVQKLLEAGKLQIGTQKTLEDKGF
jgi:hypothetical protein